MKPIQLIPLILALAGAGSSCSPAGTAAPVSSPETVETLQATETATAARGLFALFIPVLGPYPVILARPEVPRSRG